MIARKIQRVLSGRSRKTHFLLLFALCGLIFFWNLNAARLFDRDEGAFSEATREMLERGDLVSPTLNGESRYDKPIWIYWMQAAGAEVFGVNEIGMRVSSALAGSLWIFATYFFARRFFSAQVGLAAAFIQATSLFVFIIGRMATADAWLNLFIALSFFDVYRHFDNAEKGESDRWSSIRVYLWAGLGFLTKGPIAIAFPFGTALIFGLIRREFKPLLRLVFNPLGWLIFLAVAAPWYVVQTMRDGGAFVREFFLHHNVARYEQPMESHAGSLLYYVPVAFLLVLPYGYWLLRLIGRVGEVRRDRLKLFLWLWFGLVFVFFSLSGSKLPHYLLYGMTPVFMMMAADRRELRFGRLLTFSTVIGTLLLLFALPWIFPVADSYLKNADDIARISLAKAAFDPLSQILLGVAVLAVIAILLIRRIKTAWLFPVAALIQAMALIGVVLPRIGAILQTPTYDAARFVSENHLENVVVWDLDAPSFSFYRKQITPWRHPAPGDTVVTHLDRLKDIPNATVLFQEGPVVIAQLK